MFKKPFSVLAAFALGLVISVSIMACADDLQEIVNCNCNDTIKDLLKRIEALEEQINEEPDYDALVQLVVDRLNTSTPSTGTGDSNEERIATIEQEVARLKNANDKQRIGNYSWKSSIDACSQNCTYEYDDLGRLSKIIQVLTDEKGNVETLVYNCSYNGNVCTLTGTATPHKFVLANADSQDFTLVNHIITNWTFDW